MYTVVKTDSNGELLGLFAKEITKRRAAPLHASDLMHNGGTIHQVKIGIRCQTLNFFVLADRKKLARSIPQERISERTAEDIDVVTHHVDEISEVVQSISHERISKEAVAIFVPEVKERWKKSSKWSRVFPEALLGVL